jgi:hypothetical protein
VLLGIFILLLVLAILAFVLENQQSVSLLFLGWRAAVAGLSDDGYRTIDRHGGPMLSWFLGRSFRASRKRLV